MRRFWITPQHGKRQQGQRLLASLAVAALVLAPLAPTPALAEDQPKKQTGSGGKKTAPKPSQVDEIPGDYFQLEASWVPVIRNDGAVIYESMVLRVFPEDDQRVAVCLLTPHLEEDLMIWFNNNLLSIDTYNTPAKLDKYVNDIVVKRIPPEMTKKIDILTIFKPPDQDSEVVSRACK